MVDPIASARALQFPAYQPLTDELAGEVAAFNRRALEFLELTTVSGDPAERSKRLEELAALWDDRRVIAEKMVAELAIVRDQADAAASEVERHTVDRFASVGITLEGMPAARFNREIARCQLENLLRFDPQYRQAVQDRTFARDQLKGAESQRGRSKRGAAQIAELIRTRRPALVP